MVNKYLMNQTEILHKLNKWLVEFVEVPNSKLGNWAPCPYARQARIKNDISIKFAIATEFDGVVKESLEILENKEVVVICFDHTIVPTDYLQQWVKKTNEMLMPINYVILEDHPDIPEFINNVKMNFTECGLLVIQKLDKLSTASETLKQKGYYNIWQQKDIDEVVTWRNIVK